MKTIVMTGGTAGIGLFAAKKLQATPEVRLLLGARSSAPGGIESLLLDLTSLNSVRGFTAAVERELGGEGKIDALILNAGTQAGDVDQRTEDGFETTFAVNHLAHFLLLRLLMPRLAPGAVVVITTSNLHDPKTNPVAAPEHADAEKLSRGQVELGMPQRSRGMRAYATSKLCNVIVARALATSSFACDRGLAVVAFNPGLTPGTQLSRNQSHAVKFFFAVVVPILGVFQRMNSVESGGGYLADLAIGRIVTPSGRLYASQIRRHLTWPDISELASDDVVMAKLWKDSATMVGLPDSQ